MHPSSGPPPRCDDEERQRLEEGRDRTAREEPSATRLARYLPLSLLATAAVTALPVALTAAIVPPGGPLLLVASAALAVAISLAVASAAAALWKRWPRSRDLVFADLMLWGWLRRLWTERRLRETRALYESVAKASPGMSIELLERLSRLLQARDAHTHGHSQRVARHAVRIARAMRLSPAEIAKIRTAAAVHDVGKLYTPRAILNNPRPLTDAEFDVVKRHPVDGADMLGPAGDRDITAMVRHHHERLDGRGYPDGLTGGRIPLGARIIAVADTFDAITSRRPYRPASSHKKALDVLSKEAGAQLDGAAVAAFRKRYSARRPVAWLAFAAIVPQRALALLQASSSSIGLNTGLATRLLPALGAAGALALSHGAHHSAPHGAPAPRHAGPRTASAQADELPAPLAARPRHRSRQGASIAPLARSPRRGSRTPSTRRTSSTLPTTATGGPPRVAANAPESPSGGSTPTATASSKPPPPATTTPRTPPPATVPKVPGVKLPSVEEASKTVEKTRLGDAPGVTRTRDLPLRRRLGGGVVSARILVVLW